MKKVLKFFFSFLFLCLANILNAQTWPSDYQQANSKYQEGDHDGAYEAANNCLESYLREDGSISPNYAAILRLASNICYEKGLYN